MQVVGFSLLAVYMMHCNDDAHSAYFFTIFVRFDYEILKNWNEFAENGIKW